MKGMTRAATAHVKKMKKEMTVNVGVERHEVTESKLKRVSKNVVKRVR